MKLFIGACIGPLVILLVAALFLINTVRAGEACHGKMVKASWYGSESGNRTASGLAFNGRQMIVAHRTLPFHTRVRVTYRGRSVEALVEDRGPAKWTHRDVDLSHAVASRIGMISAGVASVCLEVVG